MAQQIKLRRGPVGNLSSVATVQGELLLATGSISDLSGPFLTMTGTGGNGTSTIVGKIYEGTTAPSIAGNTVLTGTPFYATGNNTLYRLNASGNEALDLSGNLENTIISSIIASGSFSGSFEGDGSGLTGLVNDLDFAGDTGTGTVSLLSETFTIAGGGGIDTSASLQTLTISVDSGSLLPYYSGSIFSTVSGEVTIDSAGVATVSNNVIDEFNLTTSVAGAGLDGGNGTPLAVQYGSTSDTAVQGNTTITINGTANEIEITGTTGQALGAGPAYTIGLPDDVIITGSLTASTGSIVGDLLVGGNLTVQGTQTIVDSTTIQLGDNIIELNGSGVSNGGLLVKDVDAPSTVSGSLLWDSTNDYWKGGPLGSEKEIALLSTDPTTNAIQKIDSNGHLVDSTISDDGSDVTLTGELIVQGLTADSFVVTNASSQLLEVTPTTAGDLVQWNGSSFVASRVIDGGTF